MTPCPLSRLATVVLGALARRRGWWTAADLADALSISPRISAPLLALERRGLVERVGCLDHDEWRVTDAGVAAAQGGAQ